MHLKVNIICPVLLILLSWNEIITFDCSNFYPGMVCPLFPSKNLNKILQIEFLYFENVKSFFSVFFFLNKNELCISYLNWELCVDCNFFFKLLCICVLLYRFVSCLLYCFLCSRVYFHISIFLIISEYR